MHWQAYGECLKEDAELFFPVGTGTPAEKQVDEAKAVCRRCRVREQCLGAALELQVTDGVWGGLAEDERRGLRRRELTAR